MARFFDGQAVELLAPAGNFSIFKEVIKLPCDAVYLGGKILNMRLHRKDFNFSDSELKEAVEFAHSLGKKIYVTVNNLHSKDDILALPDYLAFLNEIKPDALIIQDFSVLTEVRQQSLSLPLHASVMANVHNFPTIERLLELGISRVVMSREIPLSYINGIKNKTKMEFEYFVHGDMCVANGGQCYYSSFIFGQSSNRGLCMKPCRWAFDLKKDGKRYSSKFPLAVKDMCMVEYLPELIGCGVTSFKIEGRMREFSYLRNLIEVYSDAIDRYINEPLYYDRKKDLNLIYENRNRDLSTAYAFGNPGLSNINERFEGTGKFYSTGKVFSTATAEQPIINSITNDLKNILQNNSVGNNSKINLSVRVESLEQAMVCINKGVERIYLSSDTFLPNRPFTVDEINTIVNKKKDTKIILALPHMMTDIDFERLTLTKALQLADGVLCTSLGAIAVCKKLTDKIIIGDYPLNIYNTISGKFYCDQGVDLFTLSVEMPAADVKEVISTIGDACELIVHGSPTMLYLDHDLFENLTNENIITEEKNKFEPNDTLVLIDEKGTEHPVYKDCNGHNHVLSEMDICFLPLLDELYNCGLTHMRIEGCHLSSTALDEVISFYQRATMDKGQCNEIYNKLLESKTAYRRGLTYGAFSKSRRI